MNEINLTYLSQEMIIDLNIQMNTMIPLIVNVLKDHSKGELEIPPKPGIHTDGDAFIHAMPGYIPRTKTAGMKWVSGYPNNYKHDLPQIIGLLILNDTETGVPLAVMDSRWITAVRTSIVSAVTAKYCAPKNTKEIGIVGAGIQGKFHAIALKEVLPELEKIKVYDVFDSTADTYVELISEKLNIEVERVCTVKDAVTDSDIVVTATQRLERPIIQYDWLKKGVLGIGLEAGRAWGSTIVKMDKFITDDWEQTKEFVKSGAFPKEVQENYTELGEVVSLNVAGRSADSEQIMAGNVGISAGDLAIAQLIYDIAKKENIGISLPLMKNESLFK